MGPTFAHSVSRAHLRNTVFLCARRSWKTSIRLLASNAVFRSMMPKGSDGRRYDNDRSAATGDGFLLCARQRDHNQDHDVAGRVGQGATRRAEEWPVRMEL